MFKTVESSYNYVELRLVENKDKTIIVRVILWIHQGGFKIGIDVKEISLNLNYRVQFYIQLRSCRKSQIESLILILKSIQTVPSDFMNWTNNQFLIINIKAQLSLKALKT